MKKVLIVGYFWPYHPGGSKRMAGLAKHLPEFGWQPIILSAPLKTRLDNGCGIVEVAAENKVALIKQKFGFNPGRGLQEQIGVPAAIRGNRNFLTEKILKLIEGALTYPDVEAGWKLPALAAAKKLIVSEKIDAVISVWPITSHLIAKEIKQNYNLPWIADFPDLWAKTYAYSYGPLRQWLDVLLEKKTLKFADRLTVSSRPLASTLEQMHKKEVSVIKIGFDPDIVNDPPAALTKEFTITYTGIFYGKERNPFKFFEALRQLMLKNLVDANDFKVRFYGAKQDFVQAGIEKYGLSAIVGQYGQIQWQECLRRQRESQLLLQLNWENKKEKGAYSGKITEYLAARRPILSVGGWGGDVMEELFSQTKAGAYCLSSEAAAAAILEFYNEYKQKWHLDFRGNLEAIDEYSNRHMAKKFCGLLDGFFAA